ncbi:hypothetical protein [Legionella sp.]|uniref:hypothetical protein n=1 Tax=Legionella sp. TaxID=459 RepID=UPI003C9ECEC6
MKISELRRVIIGLIENKGEEKIIIKVSCVTPIRAPAARKSGPNLAKNNPLIIVIKTVVKLNNEIGAANFIIVFMGRIGKFFLHTNIGSKTYILSLLQLV